MRIRDERYGHIISLYKDGKINTLTDIFKTVPKTIVSKDIGKRVADFNKMLNRPGLFEVEEIYLIGRHCGLSESQIYALYEDHYLKIKEGKISGDGKKIKKNGRLP